MLARPESRVPDTSAADLNGLKTIGRYEIVKKLGQGSKGSVYLGKDPYIDRQVAIKAYRLPNDTVAKNVEKYKKKFFVEAQLAGRLVHPNIVTVYDADLHEDLCYITMEYVDGATFAQYCKPLNLLPAEKVLEMVFSVCKGLDFAHQNGVIHRDIKPSNLMLTAEGQVKITDFSIAYVAANQRSKKACSVLPRICALSKSKKRQSRRKATSSLSAQCSTNSSPD